MIISASYKTDIPAFYGAWFRARLAAGGCEVTNPWNGRRFHVDLRPEAVSGFVFWTRNLRPFFATLEELAAPFVVQMTITGYPKALEPAVVAADRAIADARRVADRFGPGRVVWRYDPILISAVTPPAWHRQNFAQLAGKLHGVVDEAVVSFAHMYRKTQRNLDAALTREGWRDPATADKCRLVDELAAIAARRGLTVTVCAQPDLTGDGVVAARCIDAARLSRAACRPVAAKTKGNRPGCACAESRDIGAYDTCPHGCAYCYAVANQRVAKGRHGRHAPDRAWL